MKAKEMRSTPIKAAEFVFCKCQKERIVKEGKKLDESVLNLNDVPDGAWYYGGFLIVPRVFSKGFKNARLSAAANKAH